MVLTSDILIPSGPTGNGGSVWAVTSLLEPRLVLLALPTQEALRAISASGRAPPMAILEPRLTASGGLEVRG